jgi:hypothetical protein
MRRTFTSSPGRWQQCVPEGFSDGNRRRLRGDETGNGGGGGTGSCRHKGRPDETSKPGGPLPLPPRRLRRRKDRRKRRRRRKLTSRRHRRRSRNLTVSRHRRRWGWCCPIRAILKPLVTRCQSKTKTITSASINPAGPGAAPSDLDGAAPSPVGFMDAVAIVVVFRVISYGKWFRMSGSLRNETKMKTQSRSEGKMTTLLAASHG